MPSMYSSSGIVIIDSMVLMNISSEDSTPSLPYCRPIMVHITADGQAARITIVPRIMGSAMKNLSTNHTISGLTTRRIKLMPYIRGLETAYLSETSPKDIPTHIMESGTVAADRVSATSSTIFGIGISKINITTAASVAIIGTFITFFMLNL